MKDVQDMLEQFAGKVTTDQLGSMVITVSVDGAEWETRYVGGNFFDPWGRRLVVDPGCIVGARWGEFSKEALESVDSKWPLAESVAAYEDAFTNKYEATLKEIEKKHAEEMDKLKAVAEQRVVAAEAEAQKRIAEAEQRVTKPKES